MCNDHTIQELLPAYLEKELDPVDKSRVELHLASCSDCREEVALLSMIAEAPVPEPDKAFWAEMPDRIYREVQAGKQRGKNRFAFPVLPGWMAMPRLAWAASLVIVIAAVSFFVLRPVPTDMTRMAQPATGTTQEDLFMEPVNLTDLSDDLSELSAQELDRVYEMLKKKEREAQKKDPKRITSEKRIG